MASLGRDLLLGALAGATGAACMSPVRLFARRRGLIDKTVPQSIEEALTVRVRGRPRLAAERASSEVHHGLDHLLHLGMGGALGTIYGLATRRGRGSLLVRGLTFGAAAWLFGAGVVIPALGAARPLWRARPSEQAVNLLAHLVFGISTALVADELASQTDHGPSSDTHRRAAKVG